MTDLAEVLIERETGSGAVLRDGIVAAVSPLTIIVPPSTVASPAAKLDSCVVGVGDFVQVLVQGANRLVIGVVGVGSSWVTTFDPVIGQGGGTPNIAHTVAKSQWHYDGGMVEWEGYLLLTGPGTAGQPLTVTLPIVALSTTNGSMGVGGIYDASTNIRHVVTPTSVVASNSNIQFWADQGTVWGATPALAIANTDQIYFHVRYRWR